MEIGSFPPPSTEELLRTELHLSRDYFTFSSAHFMQLASTSEPIHGHNYTVRLTLVGAADIDGVLVDFSQLKPIVRGITSPLNHKVLLPQASKRMTINIIDERIDVLVDGKEYRFPAAEVALLPVRNTSVECLAMHLAAILAVQLAEIDHSQQIERFSLTIEESPGQAATTEIVLHEGATK